MPRTTTQSQLIKLKLGNSKQQVICTVEKDHFVGMAFLDQSQLILATGKSYGIMDIESHKFNKCNFTHLGLM